MTDCKEYNYKSECCRACERNQEILNFLMKGKEKKYIVYLKKGGKEL